MIEGDVYNSQRNFNPMLCEPLLASSYHTLIALISNKYVSIVITAAPSASLIFTDCTCSILIFLHTAEIGVSSGVRIFPYLSHQCCVNANETQDCVP